MLQCSGSESKLGNALHLAQQQQQQQVYEAFVHDLRVATDAAARLRVRLYCEMSNKRGGRAFTGEARNPS